MPIKMRLSKLYVFREPHAGQSSSFEKAKVSLQAWKLMHHCADGPQIIMGRNIYEKKDQPRFEPLQQAGSHIEASLRWFHNSESI